MRRLHLAELRASWSAWLGVSVVFVTTSFALSLSALCLLAGVRAIMSGTLDLYDSTAFAFNPAQNLVFCGIVGMIVTGSATSLVVDSRRGSLARLALAGATPRQVVGTVVSQLAVVSLACSVLGGALAYVALEPTLHYLAMERSEEVAVPAPDPVYALWPVLAATVLATSAAVLGGLRQAHRASRIPPVEALRQASGTVDVAMTPLRWTGVGLCALLCVGAYAAVPALTAVRTKETISNLIQVSLGLLVVAATGLALAAPAVVGPLTRVWTRLVPGRDPAWQLARATTVARAARLTRSVVPVMLTVGLLFGMLAQGDTLQSSLLANGYDIALSHLGPATMLVFLALPLGIALAGGVGSLVMMARQRDAELALSGIVGTTPAQRVAVPVLEAVVITVTGTLMSLAMVGVSIAYLAVGFPAGGLRFAFSPSWSVFGLALVATLLVTASATLLPTLASLRRPEPRVIARLVAE